MELTILGSGTCIPSLKRRAPAYLLKIGKKNILIDSGSGTIYQLEKIKLDFFNLDFLIYTHLHPDHVSDLTPILQILVTKIKTFGFKRRKPLYVIGPKGFKKYLQQVLKFQLGSIAKLLASLPLKVLEISEKIKFDDWQLEAIKVLHTKNSLAYRFNAKNKSFVYSGDTAYCHNIINLSKNADLLLLESSYPEKYKKIIGHLTSIEAAKIAKKAEAKKLVLTHFYPPCERVNLKKEAEKFYPGPIIIARDLMKIKV